MSSPSKRIRPLSVASMPEIWPMSVVLPAPFGPMSACTSPCSTLIVTSSVATTPPKLFETLASSSTVAGQHSDEALRRGEHDREQHDAHREAGVILVVRRKAREPADLVVGD